MEESNEPNVEGRLRDRSRLPGAIVGLLTVVLALQLVSIGLHFSAGQRKSETPEAKEVIELRATPTRPLEGDPRALELASKIIQAMGTSAPGALFVEDVRIEAATGIDLMVIGATLQNTFPVPMERAVGRIELRTVAGDLVYQATCETRTDRIRLLIDNPPPFERARILLEEIRFHTPGFREEAAQ